MPAWNPQANEIFLAALEITAPGERAAYVQHACHDQAELRSQVQALLRASEQAESFLEAPATAVRQAALSATEANDHSAEKTGALIGPYKLLEQIGEGGMGLVYMAEQQRPVRRLVALKLVKPGMDSKQVIARFEAERQALAMMDHPNIAKVLEAGTTDAGRPYFVMELVRGIPINEFCDQKRLTVRERLELFNQVCQAVQHAHQKGIIHRDLKPSNVLVTQHDVLAVPKVIDFGIAKALGPSLTDHTLYTGFAQLVGTPLYMSPEQAEMNQLGVDTRSDVYSLGVLLYELLTGTTPFDKETLRKAGLDEMRRVIREEEPPRPSARISTLEAQALSTVSVHRNTDPRRISTALRGELDWIVMKGLEKDRNRRYESASELARDIQRYLGNEPVEACPPSVAYRLKKYAQRHRVALLTTSLIAAALVLGTGISLWQAWEATASRNLANARLKSETAAKQDAENQRRLAVQQQQLTEEQRQLAEERLKRAEANYQRALSTVDRMLQRVGGEQLYAVPKMLPVQRQLLEDAATIYEEMIRETPQDPKVRFQTARTYVSLVNVNGFLKDYQQRDVYAHRSIELLEQISQEHPEEPDYANSLAEAYWLLGNGQLKKEEVESLLRRAVEVAGKVVDDLPQYPGTALSKSCLSLAHLLEASRPEEAERHYRRAVSCEATREVVNPEMLSRACAALAQFLSEAGRLDEAEQEFHRALSNVEKWLVANPNGVWIRNARFDLSQTHEQFGRHLFRTKQLDAAEREFRLSLELAQKLRRDFPDVASYESREKGALDSLLGFLRLNDRTDDVQKLLAETAAGMSPSTFQDYVQRAEIYLQLKEPAGAMSDYAQALQLAPGNVDIANNLGKLYTETKQYDKAAALLDNRIETDSGSVNLLLTRADLYAQAGQYDKALADYKRAFERKGDPLRVGSLLCRLSQNLSEKGKCENAILFAQLALKVIPGNYVPQVRLGEARLGLKQFEQALSHLNAAIELAPSEWWVRKRRIQCYFPLGRYAEVLADVTAAVELNPDDTTNLTWIAPALIAACPDDNLRAGLLKLADRTVELTQGSDDAYAARAILNAHFGQADQARADFGKVSKSATAGHYPRYQYTLFCLQAAEQPAYRAACTAMLAKFSETTNPLEAHFTAWTCALAPNALDDYSQAMVLAQRALNLDRTNKQYLNGLAAVQLRAGKHEEALATLVKAADNHETANTSNAYTFYLRAMAEHHLQRPDDARKSLAMANEFAERELKDADQPPVWNRKLTLDLFRQEATDLLAATDND